MLARAMAARTLTCAAGRCFMRRSIRVTFPSTRTIETKIPSEERNVASNRMAIPSTIFIPLHIFQVIPWWAFFKPGFDSQK